MNSETHKYSSAVFFISLHNFLFNFKFYKIIDVFMLIHNFNY